MIERKIKKYILEIYLANMLEYLRNPHNGLKFVAQRPCGTAQVSNRFAHIVTSVSLSYKSMGYARYYYRLNVFKRICE